MIIWGSFPIRLMSTLILFKAIFVCSFQHLLTHLVNLQQLSKEIGFHTFLMRILEALELHFVVFHD